MQEQGPGAGQRPIDAALVRGRCEVAMLELSGEIGYRALTVEKVLSHSGASRITAARSSRRYPSTSASASAVPSCPRAAS